MTVSKLYTDQSIPPPQPPFLSRLPLIIDLYSKDNEYEGLKAMALELMEWFDPQDPFWKVPVTFPFLILFASSADVLVYLNPAICVQNSLSLSVSLSLSLCVCVCLSFSSLSLNLSICLSLLSMLNDVFFFSVTFYIYASSLFEQTPKMFLVADTCCG